MSDYEGPDRRSGVAMTPAQIEDVIRDAVKAATLALADSRTPNCGSCDCLVLSEEHRRQHELIEKAIKDLSRIEDIKWGVLKAIAIVLVFAFMAFIGFKIK